jgi:hypothetical protein
MKCGVLSHDFYSTASMLTTDTTRMTNTNRTTSIDSTDSIMRTWLNGIKNILKPANIIHDLTDYNPGEWFLLALMLTIQVADILRLLNEVGFLTNNYC